MKKNFIGKFIVKINLWFLNHFLCGQRFYGYKRLLLKQCGAKIGKNVKIVGPIMFGTAVHIEVGDDTFINHHFSIEGNGRVIIGKNCDIAPFVCFFTGGHKIGSSDRRAGDGLILSVDVGDGCWIGARTSLLGNVNIGDSSVVALGSVVIRDVPKNVLVCGVPAVIKKELI